MRETLNRPLADDEVAFVYCPFVIGEYDKPKKVFVFSVNMINEIIDGFVKKKIPLKIENKQSCRAFIPIEEYDLKVTQYQKLYEQAYDKYLLEKACVFESKIERN